MQKNQRTMEDQEMTDDKALKSGKKRDLVFARVFDAPVERVWQAWTDPEQVMRWWGPNGFLPGCQDGFS